MIMTMITVTLINQVQMYLNAFVVEAYLWQLFSCINRFGSFSNVCISDIAEQCFAFLYQLNITVCI